MNTFVLKMLAVLFMFLDHIYYYFFSSNSSTNSSIFILLTCVGRLAFPLFLFCMAWGYHYTKNRKAYLIRLYISSLFMTAFMYTIQQFFPIDQYDYGNHNIFATMFLVGALISIIEIFIKDRVKGGILLGALFAVQLLWNYAPYIVPFLRQMNGDLLTGIFPNIYLNEYGFEYVALGVLMYFLREKKDLFSVAYLIFCIAQFSSELLGNAGFPPTQWLMIGALPLMMRYNREKGPGMKYFFYIFYPTHTFLLFYLANFV